MLEIKKVLCPTDFSTPSKLALDRARSLARSFGAELHVIHAAVIREEALDGAGFELPEDIEMQRLMLKMSQGRMAEAVGAMNDPRNEGITVHGEVRVASSTVPAILAYAEEIGADCIVVGSYGRRGASRLLLGSVAELVVRHADCPVLTLHPKDGLAEVEDFKRILVPVDFSPHSEAAITIACDLATMSGAQLLLAHAVETTRLPNFYGLHGLGKLTEGVTNDARRHLEDLAKIHSLEDLSIEVVVETGQAASVIARLSGERPTDLVVLSSHGHTGLPRALLGSTAEQVVRTAEAPVLTVKTFGKPLMPPALLETESTRATGVTEL